MKKFNIKAFSALALMMLFCILALIGCASIPSGPVPVSDRTEDMTSYIKKEVSENITVTKSSYEDLSSTDTSGTYRADVSYVYGDITYNRYYVMNYSYSRGGWKLDSIEPESRDKWRAEAEKPDIKRITSDLEDRKYYSGYSNMLFENKRLIEANIEKEDSDAESGYMRANIKAILNADHVHEILSIFCEYLLDEENKFVLSTATLSLAGVEVQGGVTDDLIKESLKSVNFFREEEDSVWRIGELDKLTYEIYEDSLDSSENTEKIKLFFRGEGKYMYICGNVSLEFHFSSGWYLYGSAVETESISTGMLSEAWEVNEDLLKEYLIKDHKFSFNQVNDTQIEEDMVEELSITNRKVAENGAVQTVYFKIKLLIRKTVFNLSGYAKFDLSDGHLSVSSWSETIDDVNFNISGCWSGYDVSESVISYYQLKIEDPGTGIIGGKLYIYSIDYKNDPESIISADIDITGNIFTGNYFELMDEKWNSGDFRSGFVIPKGYYLFTNDTLICENGRYGKFALSPADNIQNIYSWKQFVASIGVKELISQQLRKKEGFPKY